MRAKKMRQDGSAEFISASLNTDEFRNALRLNDEIRRGVPHTFHACAAKVWFGGAYHPTTPKASPAGAGEAKIAEFQPPPPKRGRCRDSGGGGAMSGYTFLSIDSRLHRERPYRHAYGVLLCRSGGS